MSDEIWHEGWQEEPEPEPGSHEELGQDTPPATLITEGRRAIADVLTVADATVEALARHVEEETGERIAVRRPGIMDARYADLRRMEAQCAEYACAMELITQWLLPSDGRALGTLLKIIPADAAQEIMEHLRRAGLS